MSSTFWELGIEEGLPWVLAQDLFCNQGVSQDAVLSRLSWGTPTFRLPHIAVGRAQRIHLQVHSVVDRPHFFAACGRETSVPCYTGFSMTLLAFSGTRDMIEKEWDREPTRWRFSPNLRGDILLLLMYSIPLKWVTKSSPPLRGQRFHRGTNTNETGTIGGHLRGLRLQGENWSTEKEEICG